jgi:DNA-directed RNA polymerase specialized sigma24 family protein
MPDVRRLPGQDRAGTREYARSDGAGDHYCLEQFRRAIVERDDEAWRAVYARYSGLVRLWLQGRMDPEEGVVAAFERFWRAIDADKFDRFGSLAAFLAYLKMCAQTAALDSARSRRAAPSMLDLEAAGNLPSPDDVATEVVERLDAAVLWDSVSWSLRDERERLVVYLSYRVGLSPRQIHARHPAQFRHVGEVYRLKRNALDRLRRMPAIQALREKVPA